jgi:hypothetical protein
VEEIFQLHDRDLKTLTGIVRGPGFYPTPSQDRVERLLKNGLIKKSRGTLRATLKGRLVAWMYRPRPAERHHTLDRRFGDG